MSKFEWDVFVGGYDMVAVSKERFTKEEAVAIFAREYSLPKGTVVAIGSAWVKHRAGVNEDGEPCVGWWIEYRDSGRNCPCWVLHFPRENRTLEKDYEYVEVQE